MAKTTNKKGATKGVSSPGRGSTGSNSRGGSNTSGGSRQGAKAAAPKKSATASSDPKKASPKKAAASSGRGSRANAAPINETSMFQELFLDSLKDIYYAEKALLKTLPKMRKAATSQQLQQAFEAHTTVTQQQVQRLEQVFEALGKRAQGKKCEAIEGLIKESEEMIASTQKGTMTRDVALIMAAQKVEHYEIASYGSMATLAATMGNQQIKELLGQTLQEEKQADELLSQLAENNINQQAAQNEGEGSGTDGEKEA